MVAILTAGLRRFFDPPSRSLNWAAVFWLATYAIFTFRGRLLPDGQLDWIDGKRIMAISCGALFFSLAIRASAEGGAIANRLGRALKLTALAAVALITLRIGSAELGMFRSASTAEEIRWLITWIGYFLGWVGFYFATETREPPRVEAARPSRPAEPAVWVQQNNRRCRIALDAIEWIEAEGNYARVHAAGVQGLIRMSLAQLEKRLDPTAYVRLHRSIICRRDCIAAVERLPTSAYVATLSNGTRVPVGRALGRNLIEAASRSGRALSEG